MHSKNQKIWIIVLGATCVILAILSVVFFAKSKSENQKSLNNSSDQYNLLDPSRHFFAKKDLIINIQNLREYLKSLPDKEKDWAEISIYFEVLNTGANITVNPDLNIWPASLAKLPLAMIIMKKVEAGNLSLETKIKLTKEDVDEATPEVFKEVGRDYDIKFLVSQLLIYSDNTAYRMLKRQTTLQELDDIGQAVGLDALFDNNGKVSAKEYSRLFRVLYLGDFINDEHSQFLLTLMQDSTFHGFLKAGLPDSVPFSHKWGENIAVNVHSDAGIVYVPNRPYMIAVMIQSKLKDQQETTFKVAQLMKEISARAYLEISEMK